VQGNDGGWGQDGGHNSDVREGENLESSGNDVANTAVAVLALIRSGHTPTEGKYKESVQRGLDFIMERVEASPREGLALLTVKGTQIQRKLGPHIDTFLTSMVLSKVDGEMSDPKMDQRVRLALQKTVNKIEENQQEDGSWNIAGGWAPILGTSIASRSLFEAKQKGVDVDEVVLARVDDYTKKSTEGAGSEGSAGLAGGRGVFASSPADAGIALSKVRRFSSNSAAQKETVKPTRTRLPQSPENFPTRGSSTVSDRSAARSSSRISTSATACNEPAARNGMSGTARSRPN